MISQYVLFSYHRCVTFYRHYIITECSNMSSVVSTTFLQVGHSLRTECDRRDTPRSSTRSPSVTAKGWAVCCIFQPSWETCAGPDPYWPPLVGQTMVIYTIPALMGDVCWSGSILAALGRSNYGNIDYSSPHGRRVLVRIHTGRPW